MACGAVSCLPWLRRDHFEDAVAEGRTAQVVALLEHGTSRLLAPQSGRFRHSPWHVACHRGHLEVLQALVDAALKGSRSSLLFTASMHRKLFGVGTAGQVTSELILKGCLMHSIRGGFSPLMLAARAGHVDIVVYLLSLGADIWQADHNGWTAMHHAARHNKFMVVQELLSFPSPPPSHLAARLVKPTTKLINCPDAAGWTALHYAVCTVHEETTATLLSCGANIIARTLKQHATFVQYPPGSTALHIAAAQGNLTMIIQILRAHFEGLASLLPNHLDTMERRRRQRTHPDPRLVISRTGQLPYHLARPLQRSDILEFLDPSIPLQFLLSATDEGTLGQLGEPGAAASLEADAARARGAAGRDLAVVGVPRLSLLAAKALHSHLVSDLVRVEKEQAARAEAEAARQAQERRARLQAAEAAAKQQGVWLVKRAARRSLQLLEEEEARASGGSATPSRRAPRKPAAPNTPQRLLEAVRSSISILTPQRNSVSAAQGQQRTLALEMPDSLESNPVARVAPVRRAGSVDMSVLPPGYSVLEISTRPSQQQQRPTSSSLRPTRMKPAAQEVAGYGAMPSMLTSPFQQQQQQQVQACEGAAGTHGQPSSRLLLTAAHGDADNLVGHCSMPAEERLPPAPAPSRWVSGAEHLSRPVSATPTAGLQRRCNASVLAHDQLISSLASIQVRQGPPDHGEQSPGTATTVHAGSPSRRNSATVTPLHQQEPPASPALQQLPGAASSFTAGQAAEQPCTLPLVVDASPSKHPRTAKVSNRNASRLGSLRSQQTGGNAAGASVLSVDAGASQGGEGAAGMCAIDQPDTGPQLEAEEEQGRSATQTLLQSLTRPFRKTSRVLPVMDHGSSASQQVLTGSSAQPLPLRPSPQHRDSISSETADDALDHVAEKGVGCSLDMALADEQPRSSEEDVCPVCLDDVPDVHLLTCRHALCLACAKDLTKRHCLTPALCPYCRSIISGFCLGL